MLLAAFAWWYLLRSSTSMKDSNHFNGSEGADEEKVLRYVPYTGPVIPTKRERLRIRETVVSLDLSYLSTGK
ncbi:hypothetical protein BC830DRAFT_1154088 [Chytriomyces sp. MP71]|nr:hypothetical protein BC830DRAFT_1154088 [Chytriomyces sp. MP71]